ncbi:MAG TPA: MBL fold metallo-hydrolase, partial [Tepidisphaeraceae bacterium]|nr:MBL fold metallo-hydrolase [Tepidisphaeraceae bacterium]
GGVVLIDAGIGPRTAAKRMAGTGVAVRGVAGIILTHLDRDHFSPTWLNTVVATNTPIYCAADRVEDLFALAAATVGPGELRAVRDLVRPFHSGDGFEPLPGVAFQPVALAHDREGSHGFLVECDGVRLGYATDLGRVPPALIELFCDLDLLAIESNYDPDLQRTSGRPWFLQQRITGGRGHLSNDQALAAVRQILDRCERNGRRAPSQIVLLHRSRQCNCPHLVRKLFARDARIGQRLTLAEQGERTEWLRPASMVPATGDQLTLAWG